MSRRFFVDSPITHDTAILTGQEAQHLGKVMRATVGDELILFDGSGAEFPARIESMKRSEVRLSIIGRREVDRELAFRLVIGAALPKGDRQRWLVEKLVELGVTELVPLVTARSVAQPGENVLARLRRGVVEASKQCGRNRLMVIGEACTLESFLVNLSGAELCLIAHPPAEDTVDEPPHRHVGSAAVVIGPEGGFTAEEIAGASKLGWRMVSLGPRVLRSETAAVTIAAVLAWQDKSSH